MTAIERREDARRSAASMPTPLSRTLMTISDPHGWPRARSSRARELAAFESRLIRIWRNRNGVGHDHLGPLGDVRLKRDRSPSSSASAVARKLSKVWSRVIGVGFTVRRFVSTSANS